MAPKIKKIDKQKPKSFSIVDEDVIENESDLEDLEHIRDAIAPATTEGSAPSIKTFYETLPEPTVNPSKPAKPVRVKKETVEETNEVWLEVSYTIDKQRTVAMGAKRKLRKKETIEEGHADLYRTVVQSLYKLV